MHLIIFRKAATESSGKHCWPESRSGIIMCLKHVHVRVCARRDKKDMSQILATCNMSGCYKCRDTSSALVTTHIYTQVWSSPSRPPLSCSISSSSSAVTTFVTCVTAQKLSGAFRTLIHTAYADRNITELAAAAPTWCPGSTSGLHSDSYIFCICMGCGQDRPGGAERPQSSGRP